MSSLLGGINLLCDSDRLTKEAYGVASGLLVSSVGHLLGGLGLFGDAVDGGLLETFFSRALTLACCLVMEAS